MSLRDVSRRTFGGVAVAAVLAAPHVALATPATGSRLPSPDDIYEPPATLALVADLYARMTAPLRVAGQGPFRFVVDTGANQSVISTDLAARLGLAQGPTSLLNGVAGVAMTPTATASIGVGRRVRRDVTLFVLPAPGIGADGMLGLDGLDGQTLTLDFRSRALRIDPGSGARGGPRITAMRARRRDGQLTLVDADLAGIPVTAFIDSGAQSTIGNRALQRLAAARQPGSVWSTAPIVSVTGQTMSGEIAALPHLRIGGATLSRWRVAFADLHTFRLWDLVDRPAILIGVDVLSRFEAVSLDFARDEVRFQVPDLRNVRSIHA
jgi:hypothetical protein